MGERWISNPDFRIDLSWTIGCTSFPCIFTIHLSRRQRKKAPAPPHGRTSAEGCSQAIRFYHVTQGFEPGAGSMSMSLNGIV